ncbi:MAG: sigma-70 family RNA polymerase sigma factor [Acidobacteriota bacterium]|nr:MAG: sigma-70 family RNA polymerase sigma factor [Acidobacteriota bacterium]
MSESDSETVTQLLDDLRGGNREALDRLMPLVYAEFRRLAAHYMRKERPDHTLQTTALVHEAYVRLVGRGEKNWRNRAHFFAIAAEVMRSVLVDHARARSAAKRGGNPARIPLEESMALTAPQAEELVLLDDALRRLEKNDPRQARIVELRYFTGMTIPEISEVLGTPQRTVEREWNFARTWLQREVKRSR